MKIKYNNFNKGGKLMCCPQYLQVHLYFEKTMRYLYETCPVENSTNCVIYYNRFRVEAAITGSLRYGDYGLRTTAGRALFFVRSTGLSRANIER